MTHIPVQDTQDTKGVSNDILRELFGSAHPGGCLLSMCDGSVSLLTFDVDAEAFRQMGHRNDGGTRKEYKRF